LRARYDVGISPLRDGIRMFGEVLKIRWNALSRKYTGSHGVSEIL